MKKIKTLTQALGNVQRNKVYEAKIKVDVEQVVKTFKEDIAKRTDIPKSKKADLANKPIGKDYELVYYPVYFYTTTTDLKWTTQNVNKTKYYAGSYHVATETQTTTYEHEKRGIKGKSDFYVKREHIELGINDIDKNEIYVVENSGSKSISVYEKDLFYTAEENKKNGIEAGRKAANAKDNQGSYTIYNIHIILVPVVRYQFEYEGKNYLFEMNVHNKSYCTDYPKKALFAFNKCLFSVLHKLIMVTGFLLPIAGLVYTFANLNLSGKDFLTVLLCFAGFLGAEFVALINYFANKGRRSFTFERVVSTLNPLKFIGTFYLGLLLLAIVVWITSACLTYLI